MPALISEKQLELLARMKRLKIFEKDLVEKFILGSGKGGQKINKTASCVYLKHIPSGLEIKCQSSRSREANRSQARLLLCKSLETIIKKEALERQHIAEKERRQKKKPSKLQKELMISQKRHRSSIKSRRTIKTQDSD